MKRGGKGVWETQTHTRNPNEIIRRKERKPSVLH